MKKLSLSNVKKYIINNVAYYMPVIVCLIAIIILLLIPTGHEGAIIYKGTDRCSAKVISVNNSCIKDTGLLRTGEQTCEVKLLGGKFKGQIVDGYNMLSGSLEADKIFQPGDKALVVIDYDKNNILSVNLIDHYRITYEGILAFIFILFLILFAGQTGVRAILSFIL
ncbi:MAG TPA: YibE/F family protein, partial [Lachnospiraceae bacterium]|nr:YibE/F family protein [Lachnospiraceae bacterium]